MKKGKVFLNLEYIIDLDNETMIQRARDAIYDDINYAIHSDVIDSWIEIKKVKNIDDSMIASWLIDDEEL